MDAEERGQSEAIANNLFVMSELKIPVLCVVIGEGGSGGALAVGVGDKILMLEFGTYSVISPEGCASILWKSADKSAEAANAMGITSGRLLELGLIDQVIKEPLGSAHRDVEKIAMSLKEAILENFEYFDSMTTEDLLERRYERIMNYGEYEVKE